LVIESVMKLAVKFNGKGKVSRAVQPVCGKGPELAADESAVQIQKTYLIVYIHDITAVYAVSALRGYELLSSHQAVFASQLLYCLWLPGNIYPKIAC